MKTDKEKIEVLNYMKSDKVACLRFNTLLDNLISESGHFKDKWSNGESNIYQSLRNITHNMFEDDFFSSHQGAIITISIPLGLKGLSSLEEIIISTFYVRGYQKKLFTKKEYHDCLRIYPFLPQKLEMSEWEKWEKNFSLSEFSNERHDLNTLLNEGELTFIRKLNTEIDSFCKDILKKIANHSTDVKNKIFELDKDGNGEVDAIEGNDFNTLLKKHQKTILEIDRNYVKKFVKISTYLKDKKANIQDIFNSISDTPNESVLNEYVGILKNEINTYHMILANGLTMLVALIEDDVITYEEIYESMDRINIFDSQWEKDVSQKLSDIGDGLNSLMYEIEASNRRIVNELSNLTYATEQGFSELNSSITSELQSIDSSIKFNNLLTGIQTYQMYKINKNTKSLRE